jgi:splicing factor 1
MIEKLCTPSDDDHNEHKKLQLRELAALNGTLKEVTECYHCGMDGHTPEMCPNKVRRHRHCADACAAL